MNLLIDLVYSEKRKGGTSYMRHIHPIELACSRFWRAWEEEWDYKAVCSDTLPAKCLQVLYILKYGTVNNSFNEISNKMQQSDA